MDYMRSVVNYRFITKEMAKPFYEAIYKFFLKYIPLNYAEIFENSKLWELKDMYNDDIYFDVDMKKIDKLSSEKQPREVKINVNGKLIKFGDLEDNLDVQLSSIADKLCRLLIPKEYAPMNLFNLEDDIENEKEFYNLVRDHIDIFFGKIFVLQGLMTEPKDRWFTTIYLMNIKNKYPIDKVYKEQYPDSPVNNKNVNVFLKEKNIKMSQVHLLLHNRIVYMKKLIKPTFPFPDMPNFELKIRDSSKDIYINGCKVFYIDDSDDETDDSNDSNNKTDYETDDSD